MTLKLSTLFLSILLLSSCSSQQDKISAQAIGDHLIQKTVTSLKSAQGQVYLKNINRHGLDNLLKFWVPQRKSFCGVCSAVITANTLNNQSTFNQDNFFTPQVNDIIKAPTVTKMGLTLRELKETLSHLEPKLRTEKFYAHTSGLDLFKSHLKKWNHQQNMIIVNFSRKSIAGSGMYSGHFSIVAGYDQKNRQVLILEVNGDKESFWISDRDLFTAMLAIDPVSRIPRGWATVSRMKN
jgi:hypothetical protein